MSSIHVCCCCKWSWAQKRGRRPLWQRARRAAVSTRPRLREEHCQESFIAAAARSALTELGQAVKSPRWCWELGTPLCLGPLSQMSKRRNVERCSSRSPSGSLDQRLALASLHRHAQRSKACRIIGPDDHRGRQHGVVRRDVCSIFGCLLDGLHFLFAPCVVEGTYDDRLSQENISRRGEFCLQCVR